ncbi:Membrane protein mosC [Candidatus Rhodobacter oscarellae]|uniref:Membrane protein mosC n=1 Tax=Candidatus Rhodobacter oscarellae TaxID=1675527 RepID=A0A0J9EGB6_9RHOB|nr:Membrane protein mosC [Candidatus Rhodobacter lobularis]
MQPLVLGAWFPRIPQVQAALDLSAGQLAFALMGMPVGLLIALFFGGRLAEALGTRALLTWGLLAYACLMPLPAFAISGPSLFAALLLAGLALALAELGLNVTASQVETRAGKLIMNGCHGFWSVGVLIGSAIGALCAALDIAPNLSLVGLSALSVVPLIWVARSITNYAVPAEEDTKPGLRGLSKPLMFISFFAFGVAMTEGAMADWSAVYLTDAFAASPGIAGASYTVFALFVATGRFQGDGLKARFPVEKLAQTFALIALIGLALMLLSPLVWLSFLGIGLLGYGVSLGFPLAVSAVSALPGRSSAANVAVLTQITLCGFLLGPPMIGLIADATNMRGGLAALGPFLILVLLLARYLKPRD